MPQWLKSWMLPLAILAGTIFHRFSGLLMPLAPFLLFCMLFITFCRIEPRDLRLRGLHVCFIALQTALALAAYAALLPFNLALAQGVMICFLTPTATSAPVVTGMLGGDVTFLTSSALTGNIATAFLAPLVFSLLGMHGDLPFFSSFPLICRQVMPVLILPLVCARLLRRLAPKPHGWLLRHQMLTFWLWACTLTIVIGNTVNFILSQDHPDYFVEILLALGALAVCVAQFLLGKVLGGAWHDRISGGQALGQKNTVLAIWLALTYAHPLASLAPASYAIWQNLFNSWQIWRKQRTDKRLQD
jgi:BASS family bile acid:Na+ symporter